MSVKTVEVMIKRVKGIRLCTFYFTKKKIFDHLTKSLGSFQRRIRKICVNTSKSTSDSVMSDFQ